MSCNVSVQIVWVGVPPRKFTFCENIDLFYVPVLRSTMRAKCIAVPSATPHLFISLTKRCRPEWLRMVWVCTVTGGSKETRVLAMALQTVFLFMCLVWQSLRGAGNKKSSGSDGNFQRSISFTIPHIPLFLDLTLATPLSRSERSLVIAGFITCFVTAGPLFNGATKIVPCLKLISLRLNVNTSVIRQHSTWVSKRLTYSHVGPWTKTCFNQSSHNGPGRADALPSEYWGGRLLRGLPLPRRAIQRCQIWGTQVFGSQTAAIQAVFFSEIKLSKTHDFSVAVRLLLG